MPASNEVTTVVRETSDPVPALRYWEVFSCAGPADLYWSFAWEAVDGLLKVQGEINDEVMGIITDAVNVALDVALKAAHVPDSWLPQYEAATAHLKTA